MRRWGARYPLTAVVRQTLSWGQRFYWGMAVLNVVLLFLTVLTGDVAGVVQAVAGLVLFVGLVLLTRGMLRKDARVRQG